MATVVTFNRELYPCWEANTLAVGLRNPDLVEGTETQTTATWNTDLTAEELKLANDSAGACRFGMSMATYQGIAQNIIDIKDFRQKPNADVTNNDQTRAIKDLARIVFAHLKED